MVRCLAIVPSILLLAGSTSEPRDERANVVVVLVDTLRADRLPFYGYSVNTAPFLASWAARSVVFERAWAASSWTAPATASIFTGLYPSQHGVVIGRVAYRQLRKVIPDFELNRLPLALETLAEFMRSQGYRTFGVSGNPNVSAEQGFDQGFERFAEFALGDSDQLAGVVREWSAEIRDSRPWFLYLHLVDPHAPYERREPWFQAPVSASEVALDSAAYDSEIRFLDAQIEEIFRCLGVDERTLVVFLADHGEEFEDHGGRYHGAQLYSELIHIPLFIHQPGVAPRRVSTNVSQVDLLPTLRELLGAAPSEQDEGTSLHGLTCRGEELPERMILSQRRGRLSSLQCVIAGDRKYIVTDHDPETELPAEHELFDLRGDAGEKRNLVEAETQLAERLDAHLRQFDASAKKWQIPRVARMTPELFREIERLARSGKELPEDLEEIVRPRMQQELRLLPQVLIFGGGSSHDFARWFAQEDGKTLAALGRVVGYSEQPAELVRVLGTLEVLVLCNNQPLADPALRAALFAFVTRGGGLVLLHPATWYNWSDWPEYNRELAGGGSRSHESYGDFAVRVVEREHPLTAGVPASFTIADELYRFEVDACAPSQVLALGKSLTSGAEYPVVWTRSHGQGRIVAITLGHDGAAHEHAAYRTLLANAVSWARGQ